MSSDDDGKLILYATVGFGAGIFWFFKGFKIYREYRVLADTPEVPIRSMAMGLVEIHGKAKPVTENLVNAPVSGTPCLFYKVDIEKYHRDSKGNGSWSHYKTDCNGLPFYLDDGTGRVLVNAFGAEYDLMQSARRQTGGGSSLTTLFGGSSSSAPNFPGSRYVSDGELTSYAMSTASVVGSGSFLGSVGQFAVSGISLGGGGGPFRFTEYCILPEHWYDATGTCAENPSPKDESDRNVIMKGQNEPTFLISWRNEKEVEGTLRNRAMKYVFGGAALAVACLAFLLAKFGWLF